MEVQERISNIIENKMMKHALVARAAGYSPKVFSDMLHKRKIIRPEDVVPICNALSVTPNELFGWDDNNTLGKRE